jgi:hypothetical protein
MLKVAFFGVLGALLCASAAQAGDVIVLGNTETGAVIIRGNFPNGGEADDAVHEAKAERATGWTQLFGDDEKGWGAVACVRHRDGVYFFQINGQKSEAEAIEGARYGAERFIKENGGGVLISSCSPRWNNNGQQIVMTGEEAPEWKEDQGDVVDAVKGVIRKTVAQDHDYKRDCVRPESAPSAKAELRPIGNGTMPLKDTKPVKPSSDWKPAPWCSKKPNTITGVRG